ncbi:hypothetical protein A3C86_03960 [Candidatus Kaiserbacteria bacterium RIFCSPHIGHO2_02_FULL_49_16]|uniref:Nudix hydrolase domain-containing protein n=1 Tax=Candidatus Kaiserbacteria bacterium RIFCSPHIGHO2_02_FULL_49_16 TaxID=1798490 RepID=A0A1F6DF03_9BACT|nr:MAG: hypothetical protein A3C86_03960 [Candidatus Kaiserbacteria bacterium RIFCSPHIGHO2_02_FULL_49_16]
MTLEIKDGVVQTAKAILYHRDIDKFLLVREPDGRWGLPGGAKEMEDANILTALERELFEEISLRRGEYTVFNTEVSNKFKYDVKNDERWGLDAVNNFFLVEVNDIRGIMKAEELMDMAWFGAEEASLKLDFESLQRGFEKTRKFLKKV